jgi:hypothetical protein
MNASYRHIAVLSGLFLCSLGAQAPASPPALSPQQLDSLVAPVALYPDSLLSQVLVASPYPLELVEAEQFLDQNPTLTGTKLVDRAKKERWDPSVQSLVPFRDVVKRLNSDIRWTTDLGNAFLAQQTDVIGDDQSRSVYWLRAAPGVVQPCFLSEPLVKILDDLPDSGPQLRSHYWEPDPGSSSPPTGRRAVP